MLCVSERRQIFPYESYLELYLEDLPLRRLFISCNLSDLTDGIPYCNRKILVLILGALCLLGGMREGVRLSRSWHISGCGLHLIDNRSPRSFNVYLIEENFMATGTKRSWNQINMEGSSNVSPFMPMFETFRSELDEHHDRRERIIKASRDITALSKKM